MMRGLHRLVVDTTGAAAAELALSLPVLLMLLLGSFELGNYFRAEHVVQKAVRDAARYAGRLPPDVFDCSGGGGTGILDPTAEEQIQKVAKAGDPDGDWDDDGDQDHRLGGWDDHTMTTVTLTCDTNASHVYVNKGLYADFPDGVPIVTVSATVPHPTFFGALGLGAGTFNLNAQSEAAVFGA